jgi:hypothetical protein
MAAIIAETGGGVRKRKCEIAEAIDSKRDFPGSGEILSTRRSDLRAAIRAGPVHDLYTAGLTRASKHRAQVAREGRPDFPAVNGSARLIDHPHDVRHFSVPESFRAFQKSDAAVVRTA